MHRKQVAKLMFAAIRIGNCSVRKASGKEIPPLGVKQKHREVQVSLHCSLQVQQVRTWQVDQIIIILCVCVGIITAFTSSRCESKHCIINCFGYNTNSDQNGFKTFGRARCQGIVKLDVDSHAGRTAVCGSPNSRGAVCTD